MATDYERFTKFFVVDPETNCWNWTGWRDEQGYGRFHFRGKMHGAHRASIMIALDLYLTTDEKVLHNCDNPSCVNPAHLKVGTTAENSADMRNRNRADPRYTKGAVWMHINTIRTVKQIYALGEATQKELAFICGVSLPTIQKAIRREFV